MRVTCKLFAGLMDFLPPGAEGNVCVVESSTPLSPHQVLDRLHIPREQAYLVLVNGVYIAEEDRDRPLAEGDVMAAWPPVAGG